MRTVPRQLWLPVIFAIIGIFRIHVIRQRAIMPSFVALERSEVEKDLSRCLDAIDREMHHLNQLCADWADWYDTYQFVQDQKETYLRTHYLALTYADAPKFSRSFFTSRATVTYTLSER